MSAWTALMLSAAISFAGMSVWSVGEDGGLSFHFDAIGLAAFACFAAASRCLGVMQTIFVCAAASLLIHLSMLLL